MTQLSRLLRVGLVIYKIVECEMGWIICGMKNVEKKLAEWWVKCGMRNGQAKAKV